MEEGFEIINQWAGQYISTIYFALPLYFLSGLLGSLFPCVYPIYPITAGILRNRAHDRETIWKHPLIYWLGMILAYGILGALASVSGGTFNSILQNGAMIVLLGFFFFFLAFVSADWFPLNWSAGSKWNAGLMQKKGSIFTFLMGNVAGLVASACVAPVLISMLLFLAKNASLYSLSYRMYYGTLLCLSFGAGIGLPFFIIGVLGARLPRFGKWNLIFKYSFTAAIGVVAVYQIEKGLQTMAWNSEQITLIFLGIALLFVSVILGLKPTDPKDRPATVKFYFALLCLAFALGSIVKAFSISSENFRSVSIGLPSSTEQSYETIGRLRFLRSPAAALELAEKEGKPIFIDFHADWCANCKDFLKNLEKNKLLQEGFQKAVLLKVHDTDFVFEDFANDPRFPELKIGLPFFAVLTPNGKLHWKTTNYKDTKSMLEALETAK